MAGEEPTPPRATKGARQTPPGARPNRRTFSGGNAGEKGGPPNVLGSGRLRPRATGVPEKWSSPPRRELGRTEFGLCPALARRTHKPAVDTGRLPRCRGGA